MDYNIPTYLMNNLMRNSLSEDDLKRENLKSSINAYDPDNEEFMSMLYSDAVNVRKDDFYDSEKK